MNEDENPAPGTELQKQQNLKGMTSPQSGPANPLLTSALCQALPRLPECCQFIY